MEWNGMEWNGMNGTAHAAGRGVTLRRGPAKSQAAASRNQPFVGGGDCFGARASNRTRAKAIVGTTRRLTDALGVPG